MGHSGFDPINFGWGIQEDVKVNHYSHYEYL